MKEDVSLELAEEEQRERARIGLADRAGLHGAREVVREDLHGAARRDLFRARVERHDQRGGVHLHRDGGEDDFAEEGEETAGELAEHVARVGFRIELGQRFHEFGQGDGARAHGRAEELLLGIEVAEDGRGRDVERPGDVGQGGGGEPARGEGGAGSVENLVAGDARRSAHR